MFINYDILKTDLEKVKDPDIKKLLVQMQKELKKHKYLRIMPTKDNVLWKN